MTACKFGVECQRPDCWFEHPRGRQIDGTSQSTSQGFSNAFGSTPTYKTNTSETFWRSKSFSGGPAGQTVRNGDRWQESVVPTGFQLIPCKFGASCKKWPDCPFLHAEQTATNAASHCHTTASHVSFCTEAQAIAHDRAKTVDCKFGSQCRNYPNCSFRHPRVPVHAAARCHFYTPAVSAPTPTSSAIADRSTEPGDHGLAHEISDDEESYTSEYRSACGSDYEAEQGLNYNAAAYDPYSGGWVAAATPLNVPQDTQLAVDVVHVDDVGQGLLTFLRDKFGHESLSRLKVLAGVKSLGHNCAQQQLWAQGLSLDPVETKRKLAEQVEAAQQELKQQVRELPMVGATRLLLGCGGEVLHVLTSQDYATVVLTGMPQSITEADVKLQMQRFGEVSAVVVVVRSDSIFARVTFREPSAALAAVEHSKGAKPSDSRRTALPFDVKPYIPKNVDGVLSQSNRLVVSWPVGIPTGSVTVTLSSANNVFRLIKSKDRNSVLYLSGDPYFCDRAPGDSHSVTLKLPKSASYMQPDLFKKFRALRTALETKLGRDAVVNVKVHQKPKPTPNGKDGRGRPRHAETTRSNTDAGAPRKGADTHQVAAKLKELFSREGQVEHVVVMPLGPGAHQIISRAQVWMSSPQMCRAAQQALDDKAEFGSGFLKVKWDCTYSITVDYRTYNAIKNRIQEVGTHLSRELPGVQITVKPVHSPGAPSPPHTVAQRTSGSLAKRTPASHGCSPLLSRPNLAKAQPRQSSTTGARTAEHGLHFEPRGGGACGAAEKQPDVIIGAAMTFTSGKVCVQVECKDERQMPAVREMLEPCFKGREFDAGGAEALAVLLTPRGKAFLQELEDTYTEVIFKSADEDISDHLHIRWERLRNRLVLFGNEVKVEMAIEDIKSYLECQAAESERSIPLTRTLFGHFLRDFDQQSKWLMGRSGVSSVSMDIMVRGLKLVGKPTSLDAAEALLRELQQASPNGKVSPGSVNTSVLTISANKECPVCRCEADNPYCLAVCGHTYCSACLQMMMEAAARSNNFPLKCCSAGCTECVSLVDLSGLLAAEELDSAYRASFRSHLDARHDVWGNCFTPDCPQVFRKAQPTFHCDICEASWCTQCQEKAHEGMTCAAYKDLKGGHQSAFEAWKQQHTKPCPNCRAPIEKDDGCNHMTCTKCQCHFCWLCAEKFKSGTDTYAHLNAKHGGIFDRTAAYAW